MKKLLLSLLVFSFLFTNGQQIPAAPNPPRLVNDFAHVLTADQTEQLESKLVAYDDSTSIQIAIVTIQTTGDYPIEDYALKILRDWKIGNKKTNNGLLILASIQDHKVYIATGYGMEGSVPDITAKQIIESDILPNFRTQDYYSGFDQGSDAIIKASRGEYTAPADYNQHKQHGGGNIFGIIIFIVIIVVLISRGGGRGGGGGMFSGSGVLPFLIGNMIGGAGRGGWSGGGGGGGWSGGGGGGGFGGFGGGSGGGGGAGGSW